MRDWGAPIRERLAGLNLAPARAAEIVEELAEHLEQHYKELVACGVPDEEAQARAIEGLESQELLAQRLRQTRQPAWVEPLPVGSGRRGNWMESLWHDGKVALRMLRNRPAFSASVIGMLALGVAGNAAIFSIFNGLFLRPLPFAEPSRLVELDETAPKWNLTRVSISNPDSAAWQKGNATFDGMAFFDRGGGNLSTPEGSAQRIKTANVTKDLLSVLGLKPAVGRDILPEEDRPGANRVILLGYDLWQRMFHGDTGVVGRVLKLSERPYTVIGVLPREAMVPPDVDAWIPLALDLTKGGSFHLTGVGRLKRGVSMEQARADLVRVHKYPGKPADDATSPTVAPLRDRYLGDYKVVTRILLGAVGVVLLIACVNIAGLMLVRGESRAREIAIRTAIGASRIRITRQLLTESLVLAAGGGVLGVALGEVFLKGLVQLMPDDLPKWVTFDLDGRFAIFCVLVTGAAAALFGLAPALQAATVDTRSCLQEAARSTLTRGRRAVLSVLVAGEIALALMLLASSGLLLQAFRKVMNEDPGFRPQNVMTFSLVASPAKYGKPEQQLAFYRAVIDRLRVLPGVSAASAASIVPLDGHTGYFFRADDARHFGANETTPVVLQVTALPGYFDAMGITLKAGRVLEIRDDQPAAPKVVVVNEAFAKNLWGTLDAIGRRIQYPGGKEWFQVVGVARDMRHYGLDREVRPEVFVPFTLSPTAGLTIAMHSSGDVHSLMAPAREVIRQIDPDLPIFNIRTMSERLDRSLWVRRAYSWLFVAFAAMAILLAFAGVYGVISFAVSQRTREIGIRIALGARPGQVMRVILGQGMGLVAIGVAAGLAASQMTAGVLESMLFGVSTRDVSTYLAVVLGVVLVGLAANYLPARRAAAIEPVRALRAE